MRQPAVPRAIDPDALVLLAAVVRGGGIRAGAAALRLPRSTVSRRLEALERAVGARLIARTSRRFQVTDLGRALVEQAGQIEAVVRASEQLIRRAATEPTGTLHVAIAPLLGQVLAPVVAEYLARHPRMRVQLHLAAEYLDLRRSSIDIAVRHGPLADVDDLYAVRLGTSITGCYAHPSYLAARGTPRAPAALATHDCIVVGDGGTSWLFHERGRPSVVEVPVRIRVNDHQVAAALAASGAGIVRLAQFYAAPRVAAGELTPVLASRWPEVPVFAVHTSVSPAPTKIRTFMELVRAAAAAVLAP